MPHLIQPAAGEHSTHRSAAGLRDQADNQPDKGVECGGGKARPKHGQETVRTRKSCERASQEPAWPVRVADAVAVAGGRG